MTQTNGMERILSLMESDPRGFQELMGKLAGKMLVPHSEGQKEVLMSDERFLVLCAGRRWGKSLVGAAKALRQARKGKQTIWWVAPTYKVVKRGYEAVINQLPEGTLTKAPPPDSVFDAGRSVRLTFKNGSKIEFYSAERPEGMLGGSADFIIMDEAATMPEHTWTQIIRPTLADRAGRALFISTPRGRNWFYYLWLKGQNDLEKDYRSWHFPSRTNPTIPASEFDDMANEMPQIEYEQEILAEFISEAASVFRMPTNEDGELTCVKPMTVPRGHVILGIDLAKHSDYTVITGVRSDDRMPCYHDRFNQISWPKQRERIHEAVDTILNTADGITILMDTGGPGDVIYDDLTDEGMDVVPINFTKWKENAVKLLASDIEQGRAFIHEEQLSEFEHYSYSITAGGRWRYEAARGHDDEVSAMLLAHWGVVHEGAPNVSTLTVGGPPGADERVVQEDVWDDEYAVDTGIPKEVVVELRDPTVADLMNNQNSWF